MLNRRCRIFAFMFFPCILIIIEIEGSYNHLIILLMERKWAHKTEIRQERWHIKKAEHYGRFLHICLIVLLNTGNLVMFYQSVYCFFKL